MFPMELLATAHRDTYKINTFKLTNSKFKPVNGLLLQENKNQIIYNTCKTKKI